MPPDLSRSQEVTEEGNLLIEAVTLLVQRQRETESWVAEQLWQADERAAATDRRYAELEARLEGIEEHLARLVHEIEPRPGDVTAEGLARLREQVEELRSGTDGRPARSAPVASVLPSERGTPALVASATTAASAPGVTFWDLLGSSPQDRFGVLLIGAGAVAVLYAILIQLRF